MKRPLPKGKVRLERALSKLGLASRTQARERILAGRVRVGGVVRKDPAFPVAPERARIEIDGEPARRAAPRHVLLHKPRGVVTTRADEKGRATVFSLLGDEGAGLHAVGRLDQATSGVLLLTNDTRLSSWLTDPRSGVRRVYVVSVRGFVSADELGALERGIVEGGEGGALLRPDRVVLRKASGRESHLTVELTEGKNREIRRMFAALGHEVTRLKRVAFGALSLEGLEPGQHRVVSAEELRRVFPKAPLDRGPKAD